MGTWGHGIEENDTTLDVAGTFVDRLARTQSITKATAAIRKEFASTFADEQRGPQARQGLALAQWRYGALDPKLYAAVCADHRAGRRSEDYGDREERIAAERRFLARLAKPNARPRAMPKPPKPTPARKRAKRAAAPLPPAFRAGECLAVRKGRGLHRAALVLVAETPARRSAYNIIVTLAWKGERAPTMKVFAAYAGAGKAVARKSQMTAIATYGPAIGPGAPTVTPLGRIAVVPSRFGIAERGKGKWRFVAPGPGELPDIWQRPWDELLDAWF